MQSAPLIFTAVTDTLEEVVKQQSVRWLLHYLDDFIKMGRPGSQECEKNKKTLWRHVNTIAQEKCVRPSTCLTFLGIEIDMAKMELRLPEDKLTQVREVVTEWLGRKAEEERLNHHWDFCSMQPRWSTREEIYKKDHPDYVISTG